MSNQDQNQGDQPNKKPGQGGQQISNQVRVAVSRAAKTRSPASRSAARSGWSAGQPGSGRPANSNK